MAKWSNYILLPHLFQWIEIIILHYFHIASWDAAPVCYLWYETIGINLQLTHWGLVTPYGDRDLGQHWLR